MHEIFVAEKFDLLLHFSFFLAHTPDQKHTVFVNDRFDFSKL